MQVILEGTMALDPHAADAEWLEFQFPCKPGNVTRAPCLISPYHYVSALLTWTTPLDSTTTPGPLLLRRRLT